MKSRYGKYKNKNSDKKTGIVPKRKPIPSEVLSLLTFGGLLPSYNTTKSDESNLKEEA